MYIIYQKDSTYEYIIENGFVLDCKTRRTVTGKEMFEKKDFELLKRSFVSAEQYFHAYVLDEIQAHTQQREDIDIDLEFLHDSIVKIWLSNKLSSTTIEDLIKCYMKDPKEYIDIYFENIGRFLTIIQEAA